MKISVSSYSYHQYIRAGKMTQLDVIAKAKEMGFAGVDFTDLNPCRPDTPTLEQQIAYAKEIRKAADEAGIEIVAYTIGANLYKGNPEADAAEVERLKGQLQVAAALGTKILRHDVCHKEKQEDGSFISFGRMLPTIAENARKVTEYAESLGIRTCSENHGFVAQDSHRMEQLIAAVNHKNYGLLIDMGNFTCVDEAPAQAVSRLASYAIHVHAKDFYITPFGKMPRVKGGFKSRGCNDLCGCAIGEGDVPVEQCIAILKRVGYDGWLTIEYEGVEDCIEGITRGKANLERFIAG